MQSSLHPFHLSPSASPFGVGRVLLHTLNEPLQSGPVQHGQLQMQHVQALCQASLLGSQQTSELVHQWLAAGVDLEDVYLPYRSAMSTILEVPLDKINLNDPTLTGAITAQGNMPLYEFKNSLRKDPRWQYTDNARQTVSTGLTQVLKDFGFMG
jgi:hypothetical protein